MHFKRHQMTVFRTVFCESHQSIGLVVENISRHIALSGTWLDSLKIENAVLRTIIMSVSSSMLTHHLTSHFLHFSVSRGVRARKRLHFLGLLLCAILSKPKSLSRSVVQLYAMYGQKTVAFCSNQW